MIVGSSSRCRLFAGMIARPLATCAHGHIDLSTHEGEAIERIATRTPALLNSWSLSELDAPLYSSVVCAAT